MVRNWPCEMMVFNEQMEVESRNSTDAGGSREVCRIMPLRAVAPSTAFSGYKQLCHVMNLK